MRQFFYQGDVVAFKVSYEMVAVGSEMNAFLALFRYYDSFRSCRFIDQFGKKWLQFMRECLGHHASCVRSYRCNCNYIVTRWRMLRNLAFVAVNGSCSIAGRI